MVVPAVVTLRCGVVRNRWGRLTADDDDGTDNALGHNWLTLQGPFTLLLARPFRLRLFTTVANDMNKAATDHRPLR